MIGVRGFKRAALVVLVVVLIVMEVAMIPLVYSLEEGRALRVPVGPPVREERMEK